MHQSAPTVARNFGDARGSKKFRQTSCFFIGSLEKLNNRRTCEASLLASGGKTGLNFSNEIGPASETFATDGSPIQVQPRTKLFQLSQSNKNSDTPRCPPQGSS